MFIAEIGINHNGHLPLALELIKMAKECGADVVKFQKRNPDICVPENLKTQPKIFEGKKMTYLQYKKLIEFDSDDYNTIDQFCKALKIQWTASVWDIDSLNFLTKYNLPFIKIPSACITNLKLLDEVNKTGIPVIMSDGMSSYEEIKTAINHLEFLYAILHCTTSYPANYNELDLNVINFYKQTYPQYRIGYSGHEEGFFPTMIAYSKGASIIERHITLDKELEGTDHQSSLDRFELKTLISQIKLINAMNGQYIPRCYESEEQAKQKLRI